MRSEPTPIWVWGPMGALPIYTYYPPRLLCLYNLRYPEPPFKCTTFPPCPHPPVGFPVYLRWGFPVYLRWGMPVYLRWGMPVYLQGGTRVVEVLNGVSGH